VQLGQVQQPLMISSPSAAYSMSLQQIPESTLHPAKGCWVLQPQKESGPSGHASAAGSSVSYVLGDSIELVTFLSNIVLRISNRAFLKMLTILWSQKQSSLHRHRKNKQVAVER